METVEPAACRTMAEVRTGVDALDRELLALLARRFAFMRAAARIKPHRDDVRDEPRKAEVIAAARAEARAHGVPDDLIGEVWERLVESSIAFELTEWERRRRL
jgi:isochorismate pyruvate lyase